ncbi:MAG: signal peptidase I [Candidatus Komeilibacteria bacterium RIFOXYC1_FULL_37_11]|uniref:Signal peptidase I n=1 Tax=Candidatus Komeilibacteria bacterium RIFOXYC1_FULL_37_11 TaxID=1798555 RepID=A0A1G2BYK4_9BACT|nr:MAG: signal peptidase I [Candidatus Komeilibacteria bacterium RIFOXYC1_FULL_37_11]OGY95585.1 MAG: signal peptidase I [Candidatus Komeilibacteria bacterium RIFOXYD1_FULL_37_29]
MDMSNFSEDDEDGLVFSWFKKLAILFFEIVKVVVISLAIILPIRLFLVQPFYVEGASMEPNFYQNEYLIIDEISYRFNEKQRGEVIIFKNPQNTKAYFIKRIIGLPGETVSVENGKVFINGEVLDEPYISHLSSDNHASVILADEEYFVMGDNRTNSLDSRQLGPINKSYIIGRVWFRGWPVNRINTFNLPSYENIGNK